MPSGQQMCNWPAYKHQVLRIKSRQAGNKTWVIDLCGAQYGILSPFHEWVQYRAQYVQREDALFPLGFTQSLFTQLSQLRGLPALTYGLVGRAAHVLNGTANVWDTLNVPLSRLRTLDTAAFDQQKTSLLSALDRSVRSFVSSNNFTADAHREKQYHAQHPFEAGRCQTVTDQMSRAANLL
ncbi:hypothetical protein N0V87_003524 [Didymella glomerata]|uniref:Uncharacterized protein n=1 Tax=Didymella glomerata TaxID=749621 RepID=A0A9W9C2Q1_9PLEO|nr:hypothetical protein N0V87_003524 [Didymella glomerata]